MLSKNEAAMYVIMLMILSGIMMMTVFYIWLGYTDQKNAERVNKIMDAFYRDQENQEEDIWND